VAVFARDASSGMLTPVQVVSTGLPPTVGLAISPDGAHVYAAGDTGYTTGAVTAFQRDPATGRLTRIASWRDGVDGVQGLAGAHRIALSADGTSVYVSAYYDHALTVFARDASTGMLSFVQVVQAGVEGVVGLKAANGLVVSLDGAHLWAGASVDKAVVLFARDPNTGRLEAGELRRDVVAEWIGMGEATIPVLSPDARHLYLASLSYNALLVFSVGDGGMPPIAHCVGDCDWNTQVTVDELVKGVNIALCTTALSACEMFDPDGNQKVTVDELVRGVNTALTGCVDPLTPGDHRRAMEFGGEPRIYDVHIPPGYDGSKAVPLVLDFHGFGYPNQTLQAGLSGWRALADREGFIVAYPLGLFGQPQAAEVDTALGPGFNAGPLCCGEAAHEQIDDVGFARAIVDAVAADANIDRARIYATGHSNGGYMSSRLACEAADVFAGVAPVAGFIALYPMSQCQPSRPIAVIEFAGLHDPHEPTPPGRPTASFAYWRDVDGCGSGPPDDHVDISTSYCDTYAHCDAGVQVELCGVNANQHSWGAGHGTYLNPDLDVARTAWEFLKQFSLPQE
jgi:poly(3-hydroxybutyrate) depolymerase